MDTNEEKIKQRAFEIYEYRKEFGIDGSAEQDWLEAKKEFFRAKHPYTTEDEA